MQAGRRKRALQPTFRKFNRRSRAGRRRSLTCRQLLSQRPRPRPRAAMAASAMHQHRLVFRGVVRQQRTKGCDGHGELFHCADRHIGNQGRNAGAGT
jgi:hypothetical protein